MKRWICIVMSVLMMAGVVTPLFETNVSAATAGSKYRVIVSGYNNAKKRTKVGKGYFWIDRVGGTTMYYSKKKNGKGRILAKDFNRVGAALENEAITNGKYVYYVTDKQNIKRINISSGKAKTYRIPGMNEDYFYNFFVCGNNLYFFNSKDKLVAYNLKTKKIKKKSLFKGSSEFIRIAGKGKYLYICRANTAGKVTIYRYNLKKDKLKKIRVFKTYGTDPSENWGYHIFLGDYGYDMIKNKIIRY